MNVHHVNHVQQLQLIALCIYRCSRCGFTVRSMCECVTKSTALNCMLGICLPIPRVCTSLALLCAPSPLVVYAATETEYRVSAFRPPKISSCATRNKQTSKKTPWNRTFKWRLSVCFKNKTVELFHSSQSACRFSTGISNETV